MLIYEKENKLNILFNGNNSDSSNPDIQIYDDTGTVVVKTGNDLLHWCEIKAAKVRLFCLFLYLCNLIFQMYETRKNTRQTLFRNRPPERRPLA